MDSSYRKMADHLDLRSSWQIAPPPSGRPRTPQVEADALRHASAFSRPTMEAPIKFESGSRELAKRVAHVSAHERHRFPCGRGSLANGPLGCENLLFEEHSYRECLQRDLRPFEADCPSTGGIDYR